MHLIRVEVGTCVGWMEGQAERKRQIDTETEIDRWVDG